MSDITDQEIFASTVGEQPTPSTPEPVSEPTPAPEPAPQALDAPADAPPEPAAASPSIPPARLREEAAARRRAEERAAKLEEALNSFLEANKPKPTEAPPTPQVWEDPDAWLKQQAGQLVDPIQKQFRQFVETTSQREAIRTHGQETVAAAVEALKEAVASGQIDGAALDAKLNASMDPYGELMGIYNQRKILSEIGNDPEAYKQKIIAEFQASQGQQATPAGGSAPTTPNLKLPPSLTRATAAASNDTGRAGEPSDGELFAATTTRRR